MYLTPDHIVWAPCRDADRTKYNTTKQNKQSKSIQEDPEATKRATTREDLQKRKESKDDEEKKEKRNIK